MKRKRYSRKFQRTAVERMETCEDVGELARELGVRPRCLYKWRRKLEMVEPGQETSRPSTHTSAHRKEIHRLKQLLAEKTLELEKLTPLLIGQFDKSDVIHSITPAVQSGRPATCVQFETLNGKTRQPSNEVCFDNELGALVRWNVAEDLVEDTDYVSFEGILLPQTIRHYINGKLRMEVHQTFSVI